MHNQHFAFTPDEALASEFLALPRFDIVGELKIVLENIV